MPATISFAYNTKIGAVYNQGEGYDYSNLPPREQDNGDPVGKTLLQIKKAYPDTNGLKKYISHWHKMRASVAIRFGDRKETVKETFKSLYYNPFNYKVVPFLILVMLPNKLRINIISQYQK